MTTVVNVRVKYLRPEYTNLKEWVEDPNNVYIGRRGIVFIDGARYPPEDSIWANPFRVSEGIPIDLVLLEYKRYIKKKLRRGEITQAQLLALRGKNLGCWCVNTTKTEPLRCHGQVLLDLIAQNKRKVQTSLIKKL